MVSITPVLVSLLSLTRRERSDPIFFHFLNRELQRTLITPLPTTVISKLILSIMTCTRGPHYTTLSFLLEGGLGFAPELSFLETLVKRQMLDIISDSASLSAHVLAHRRQYGYDEARYLEYYNDDVLARCKFEPTKFKEQDTTEHLVRTLTDTFVSKHAVLDLPFPGALKEFYSTYRSIIFDAVASSDGRGITMSLFKDVVPAGDDVSLANIGRLLTYFHIKHYLNYCDADICTSIPSGISTFDIASRSRPLFDWKIFRVICDRLYGYNTLGYDKRLLEYLSNVSGSSLHQTLVGTLQHLIYGAMYVHLSREHSRIEDLVDFVSKYVDRCFAESSFSRFEDNDIRRFELGLWLDKCNGAMRIAEQDPSYKEFMLMVRAAPGKRRGRVLVLTATDREIRVARSAFVEKFQREPSRGFFGTTTIYDLGSMGKSEVILAQGAASDAGPDAISMKVVELIDNISPDYIILSGICFGLEKDKQRLGDIILSREVRNYNLQKITETKEGDVLVVPRGARVPASALLMDRFRSGKIDWTRCRVEPGLIMSGSVLANSRKFVDGLKRIEPEALAGEMEGAGLFAACLRKKVDWIIVKSICDWGFDKDDAAQENAAYNSMIFIYSVIEQGGLSVG
jgi:nucleoside phosphorylase